MVCTTIPWRPVKTLSVLKMGYNAQKPNRVKHEENSELLLLCMLMKTVLKSLKQKDLPDPSENK